MSWIAAAIAGASVAGGLATTLPGVFAGDQKSQQFNLISPEQAALLRLQAKYYGQMAPLQLALQQAQLGHLGFTTSPETQEEIFAFQLKPMGYTQDDIVDSFRDESGDLKYRVRRGPQTTYTGRSPLIDALQAALEARKGELTARPAEQALPGAIRGVAEPLARRLGTVMTQYGGTAEAIQQLALSLGPDYRARLASIAGAPVSTADLSRYAAGTDPTQRLLMTAPWLGVEAASRPLDTEGMLFDINQQMERNVLPEVRAAAIRAGQMPDVRSSGYSRLLGDVTRQYGGRVAQVFSEQEIARRNALINALAQQAQAAGAAGTLGERAATAVPGLQLEQILNQLRGETAAGDIAVRGTGLGLGAAQGRLEAERATLPMLQQFLLAGPQAEAQFGSFERELALARNATESDRANLPLALLRGMNLQMPEAPQYPLMGQTSTQFPNVGNLVGQGMNTALMTALLGGAANKYGLFDFLKGGNYSKFQGNPFSNVDWASPMIPT